MRWPRRNKVPDEIGTRTMACRYCRHFVDDAVSLERLLPGLSALSSAQGDTWGDQGICMLHERLLLPTMTCERFEARKRSG